MADEQVKQIFSARLRQQREKLNIPRKEFASTLGVSPAAVSMYETGDRLPALPMLINIARALHTSIDNLLGCEAEPLPEYERYKRYLEGIAFSVTEKNMLTGDKNGITIYTMNPYRVAGERITNHDAPLGAERIYLSSKSDFIALMRYIEKQAMRGREKLLAEKTSQILHNFYLMLMYTNEATAFSTLREDPISTYSSAIREFIKLPDEKKGIFLKYARKFLNENQGKNGRAPSSDAARDADAAAPSHGSAHDLHVEGDGGGGEDERKE